MKTKIQSYQNLLNASKAVLKGNYIAVIDNIVKEKKISNQQWNLLPQEAGYTAN